MFGLVRFGCTHGQRAAAPGAPRGRAPRSTSARVGRPQVARLVPLGGRSRARAHHFRRQCIQVQRSFFFIPLCFASCWANFHQHYANFCFSNNTHIITIIRAAAAIAKGRKPPVGTIPVPLSSSVTIAAQSSTAAATVASQSSSSAVTVWDGTGGLPAEAVPLFLSHLRVVLSDDRERRAAIELLGRDKVTVPLGALASGVVGKEELIAWARRDLRRLREGHGFGGSHGVHGGDDGWGESESEDSQSDSDAESVVSAASSVMGASVGEPSVHGGESIGGGGSASGGSGGKRRRRLIRRRSVAEIEEDIEDIKSQLDRLGEKDETKI